MKKKVELNFEQKQFLAHLKRSGYPTLVVEAFTDVFTEDKKHEKKVKKHAVGRRN